MIQDVIYDFPPLYEEISEAFGLYPGDRIIFSWGDQLYNPTRANIVPELVAHEAVHGERQGSDQQIIDWWKRYIEDRSFRLDEEVPAHIAEYQHVLKHGNRNERRTALRVTAKRLAAPLYGRMITRSAAIAVLRNGDRAGYL